MIYLQTIDRDEDKSRFVELYEEYRALAYRIAFNRMNHAQDAEDVVQHVFMKIAENIEKIEPACPKTKRLIVLMVVNRITDVLRANGKRPTTVYMDQLHGSCGESEPGGSFLEECIWQLNEKQRLVIWLKYFYGYDLHEISKMMGISLAWAQKLDQRAKTKLKELYQAKEEIV